MERILYCLLVLMVGILIGSSTNTLSCGPVPVEGLSLSRGIAGGGSSEYNESIYVYNYEFTLYNIGQKAIYVTEITPVLFQSEYILSSQESVSRNINRNITAGSSITVNGSIEMYAPNFSKEELMDFQPIMYLNISSTQTIPYFDFDE